ncbi:MAG: magnesium transporter [Caldisericaceae bacterium]|nr:magnesium transporter [Caldisericaceae bacterium]
MLFLSVIGESVTGFILTGMENKLAALPGLIILVPAMTDLKGNVEAAFGERLSTMLHLGLVKPIIKVNNAIKHNILASFTLTVSGAFLIGISAAALSNLLQIKTIGVIRLSMISTTAGIISSVLLLPLVFVFVFTSFRHHIDPDNIIAPILPVIGDIITISAILIGTILTMKLLPIKPVIFVLLAVLPFVSGFAKKNKRRNKLPKRYRYFPIIKQSLPILIFCFAIGITSGIFLQNARKIFLIYPALLALIPQVVAQGGSIGGIVGSRVSTALYLGSAQPFKLGREVRKNFTAGMIMGLVVALLVGIASLIIIYITKANAPPLTQIFLVAFLSLFILSTLMSVIAIFISFFSFKIGIDPSNVVIPVITSIGDVTGIIVLLAMIKVFIF